MCKCLVDTVSGGGCLKCGSCMVFGGNNFGGEGTCLKRVRLELRRLGARTTWSLKHVMKSSWHVAVWIDYYYCEF